MAVGSPRATSPAKLGPEITAKGRGPRHSSATWCSSLPVRGSRPLVAQLTELSALHSGAADSSTCRNAWLGTTTRTSSLYCTAEPRSSVTSSRSGNEMPGRNSLFSPSWRSCFTCAGRWLQSFTLAPLRLSTMASAVPQEPAPRTPITGVLAIMGQRPQCVCLVSFFDGADCCWARACISCICWA